MAKPDFYRHFDGMCWPAYSQDMADLQWALRYNEPALLTKSQLLVAASVMEAYAELIRLPAKNRDAIVRELRNAAPQADGPDGKGGGNGVQ